MDLESKLDKQKYQYKYPQIHLGLQHQATVKSNKSTLNRGSTFDDHTKAGGEHDQEKSNTKDSIIQQVSLNDMRQKHTIIDEFLVFKEN